MCRDPIQGCQAILLVALFSWGLMQTTSVAVSTEPKTEVFLWYVNETALDEPEQRSWDAIIGWLQSSSDAKCRQIAGQLERDRREFAKTVDQESAVLQDTLPGFSPRVDAAIFTNRLVRSGKYLLLTCEGRRFREIPFQVLSSNRTPSQSLPDLQLKMAGEPPAVPAVLSSYPMAWPEVLALCLKEAVRQFPPAQHEFILVAKSHGNEKMALTPRLIVRAEETNREELLAVAAGELPDERLPVWAKYRPGITKRDFFDTLSRVGTEQGMQFSLVFLESCEGVLNENANIRPPKNIARLFMTGSEEVNYSNLDYVELLATQQVTESVVTADNTQSSLPQPVLASTQSLSGIEQTVGEEQRMLPLSEMLAAALAARFPTLVRAEA